jgi:hypothetical protein
MKTYDFQYSDLILKIGGQIFALVLIIMILLSGTSVTQFPANAMRSLVKGDTSAFNSVVTGTNKKIT